MHWGTPLRTALVAAVLAAAAVPVLAAESRFLYPAQGATLEAGRSARITWALSATGPQTSEMELVLSLDGGRTFPVRVTRDLDPGTRELLLTVPSLPASHARLALRGGDGGEPGEEEILLVSEEFSVAADPGPPLEPALFVHGEWRTREALSSAEGPALPDAGTFGEASATIQAASVGPDACQPRPRRAAESKPDAVRSNFYSVPIARSAISLPLVSHAPSAAPRRE
jgi:hypothetical protein